MKRCQIYSRRDDLLVVAQARTGTGLWISWPPFTKVPLDAPAEDIGALLLSALDKTTYDVPAPNFRTDPMPITPVLALAGVKTWGAFVKGTELVGAELDDGRLSLVPRVNRGSRRGFDHPDAEQIVRAAELDPATIGQLLKDLFGAPVRPGGSSTS